MDRVGPTAALKAWGHLIVVWVRYRWHRLVGWRQEGHGPECCGGHPRRRINIRIEKDK